MTHSGVNLAVGSRQRVVLSWHSPTVTVEPSGNSVAERALSRCHVPQPVAILR